MAFINTDWTKELGKVNESLKNSIDEKFVSMLEKHRIVVLLKFKYRLLV